MVLNPCERIGLAELVMLRSLSLVYKLGFSLLAGEFVSKNKILSRGSRITCFVHEYIFLQLAVRNFNNVQGD
jgi:hypothetical protein